MRPERQLKKHITKYDEQNLAQKVSPSSCRLPDTDFIFHSKLPSNKNSHFTIHSKKQRKDNQTKFMMLNDKNYHYRNFLHKTTTNVLKQRIQQL